MQLSAYAATDCTSITFIRYQTAVLLRRSISRRSSRATSASARLSRLNMTLLWARPITDRPSVTTPRRGLIPMRNHSRWI